MVYEVKKDILGFENTKRVKIVEIDELFSTMQDADNEQISFTIVNPYVLREYSFDVPSDVRALIDVNDKSKCNVYNIVVIQKPLEDSAINFLAPIIINNDNKTVAQAVLNPKDHPDFGMAEKISSFKEA